MKIPPVFVRFKISFEKFWMPTIWLPVFLLWPFVFVMMMLVYFLGLIAVTIFTRPSLAKYRALSTGLYELVCELRGTVVDVKSEDAHILISVD